MNTSSYLSRFLSQNTQQAFRAKAEEEESPKKESEPASPNVELLRRVQRIVFGPSVSDLAEAKTRFASLIDALSDEETETKKKTLKPTE